MTRAPLLAALVLPACGGTTPPGQSSGPGITSVSETSGSSSTGDSSTTALDDSSGGGAGSSTGSSTGTILDVGGDTGFVPDLPPGCKGKVDLLFLISRGAHMRYVQDQFVASLPGFVQTIEDRLEGFDVHIMAANPDGEWPGYVCENYACAEYYPNCGPNAEDWVCGESAQEWRPCDSELGAGNTFNAGAYATNKRCELYGGNRYIISGEPDLAGNLECIAKAGVSGPYPATGDALIAALSYTLNAPERCNAGFLRDDALLVVVIIDNTNDQETLSSPKVQYDAVIAAKKDPRAVVMLAITALPLEEGEPDKPDCAEDMINANNYLSLLEQFPYHMRGNACADSYVPFLEDAVGMIDEACGSFVPQ